MTDPAQYISGRTVEEQMNSLITYVDTRAAEVAKAEVADDVAACAQAKTDAESARDAAILAKDTAVSTVSNCVTLNTAQNITAQKTFETDTFVENTNPFFVVKDPEEVRGTHAATDKYGGIAYTDKNGARLGGHVFKRETNGDVITYMSVMQDTVADAEQNLGILYKANGDAYGICPGYPSGAPAYAIVTQGNLDNYTPMVRDTGNKTIGGIKQFTSAIHQKASAVTGYTDPPAYISNRGNFRIVGNDDGMVGGIGFEKSSSGATRMVLSINASKDSGTGNQPSGEIHFILDETAKTLVMQPAHVDKNNVRSFGTATTLMSW